MVLEGTRDALGLAADRKSDIYERPLLYFCPKKGMQRLALEPALRLGFGPQGEGYDSSTDRGGREIWVIKRPPLVSEMDVTQPVSAAGSKSSQKIRILYTYIFRNPGSVALMPVLQMCHRFRILFQPIDGKDTYAKFEVTPKLLELM